MSEPVILIPSGNAGHMFSEKSLEELDQLLGSIQPDGTLPVAPEPPKEEPPVEAPPQEVKPPEPEAVKEPDPPSLEEEERALAEEQAKIKLEKLEAKYAEQQAHSSRLAGELGFLKKQLEQVRSAPTEPYQPETERELSAFEAMQRDHQQLKAEVTRSKVAQVAKEALGSLEASLNGVDLTAEMQEVVPKYKDQFAAILDVQDEALARQMAEAIGRSAIADAKDLHWQKRNRVLAERKASTVSQAVKDKKAATPSASGAVPEPPPKPKTYTDMTPEELDQLLRKMF